MGVLVSTMRLQYLFNLKCDLEYKVQLITQTKMSLLGANGDLLQVGNDYDPQSPIVKTLQQRQAKMKLLEQQLDLKMAAYNAQLEMINTELQSAKKMQQAAIQQSFSY